MGLVLIAWLRRWRRAGELQLTLHARPSIPSGEVCAGIVVSALAGYGAMSFMLALIDAYGATTTEVVKTLRKVMQVRACKLCASRVACAGTSSMRASTAYNEVMHTTMLLSRVRDASARGIALTMLWCTKSKRIVHTMQSRREIASATQPPGIPALVRSAGVVQLCVLPKACDKCACARRNGDLASALGLQPEACAAQGKTVSQGPGAGRRVRRIRRCQRTAKTFRRL